MKKVLKILMWSVFAIIIVIDVFLTVYLLNYNDYNVAQFKDRSFIIMDEDLENFKKGDLLLVTKNKNDDIKVGDYVFFYDVKSKEKLVNYGKIQSAEKITETETTFHLGGDYPLSSDYIIGKAETSQIFKSIGSVLVILTSRFGFLLLVILPILVVFIYQIYLLLIELRGTKKR